MNQKPQLNPTQPVIQASVPPLHPSAPDGTPTGQVIPYTQGSDAPTPGIRIVTYMGQDGLPKTMILSDTQNSGVPPQNVQFPQFQNLLGVNFSLPSAILTAGQVGNFENMGVVPGPTPPQATQGGMPAPVHPMYSPGGVVPSGQALSTAPSSDLSPEVQLALQRALAQWDEGPQGGVLALDGSQSGLITMGPEPAVQRAGASPGTSDPTGYSQPDSVRDTVTPIESLGDDEVSGRRGPRAERRGRSRGSAVSCGSPRRSRSRPYGTPKARPRRSSPENPESSGSESMEEAPQKRTPSSGRKAWGSDQAMDTDSSTRGYLVARTELESSAAESQVGKDGVEQRGPRRITPPIQSQQLVSRFQTDPPPEQQRSVELGPHGVTAKQPSPQGGPQVRRYAHLVLPGPPRCPGQTPAQPAKTADEEELEMAAYAMELADVDQEEVEKVWDTPAESSRPPLPKRGRKR